MEELILHLKVSPVQAMKAYGETAGMSSVFLNIGKGWECVINFKFRPI